jgi:hypothetical protein
MMTPCVALSGEDHAKGGHRAGSSPTCAGLLSNICSTRRTLVEWVRSRIRSLVDGCRPRHEDAPNVDADRGAPFRAQMRGHHSAMTEVTRIPSAIEQGDPRAAEQLLPLVYQQLRELAAHRLASEKPGQTLQATALVHEAYFRLVGTTTTARGSNGGSTNAWARRSSRRSPMPAPRPPVQGSHAAADARGIAAIDAERVERESQDGARNSEGGRRRASASSHSDADSTTPGRSTAETRLHPIAPSRWHR